MTDQKTTCLCERHQQLGALMSPFGGFLMPIQYSDIADEHHAVRTACGVFDVSHMGEVTVTGHDATRFVNHIFTNDVTDPTPGVCYYGMMLNEHGGVVDDLLVYKRGDEDYLLVINASNIDKDYAWITAAAEGFDVKLENISDTTGELAVQGPDAEVIVSALLGLDLSGVGFYRFIDTEYDGEKIVVSRTGYTGEDGFEIYASPALTVKFWDNLLATGKVKPCGLGCRDTLRFEVALPLYGNELSDDVSPLEAGLGMFVKLDKPEFIGREATVALKEAGVKRKIIGLELLDRAIPRHGYEVLDENDEVVGHVTTGYHALSVDKSIALAMVDARVAKLGTPLKVRIRRKTFPAVVVKKKFYDKHYKK